MLLVDYKVVRQSPFGFIGTVVDTNLTKVSGALRK
jgi:hypothetical protein